ncbi:MAG: hypothetical protein ACRDZ4_12305 [Egibacteraceae bacterium]
MDQNRSVDAEYGPSGYLPQRAAKRARKIVLRKRMGLGWPLAALAAAAVIAVAGTVFLSTWSSPPPPPWEAAGPLSLVDRVTVLPAGGLDHGALIVRADGDLRAFAAPAAPVAYCAASAHLESAAGAVWGLDGRLLSDHRGERSLRRIPVRAFEGTVYVNPNAGDALPARPGVATPAC